MTPRPMRPHPIVDALLPDRSSEIATLRTLIADAEAEATRLAEQVIDARDEAARYALLYRSILRSFGEVVRERDAARALACAIATERPVWHEGDKA